MLEDINNILIFVWWGLIPSSVYLVKHVFAEAGSMPGLSCVPLEKLGLVDCCFSATCKK